MADSKMVNIGSREREILVPAHALMPETADGKEYWQMVAEGSVELEGEALEALLQKVAPEGDEKR